MSTDRDTPYDRYLFSAAPTMKDCSCWCSVGVTDVYDFNRVEGVHGTAISASVETRETNDSNDPHLKCALTPRACHAAAPSPLNTA